VIFNKLKNCASSWFYYRNISQYTVLWTSYLFVVLVYKLFQQYALTYTDKLYCESFGGGHHQYLQERKHHRSNNTAIRKCLSSHAHITIICVLLQHVPNVGGRYAVTALCWERARIILMCSWHFRHPVVTLCFVLWCCLLWWWWWPPQKRVPIYCNIHPTRCNVTQFIFLQTALHVSDGIPTHHQEPSSNQFQLFHDNSNGVTNTRCSRYSCLRSWWWVGVPPETCREIWRKINCVTLHLVGCKLQY
jgi:hypothetical protein